MPPQPQPPQPQPPQPRYRKGDKIGGRYRVHRALAGGMSEVYLCLDLKEGLPYALKTLQKQYLNNPRIRPYFEREAGNWVALEKHPNIVRCFYMNVIEDQPFLFLEWVAGEEGRGIDLRAWLKRRPFAPRLALGFVLDVCRGLAHAAQKCPGVVHCDLKPENVLVAQGRLAKLTDFGLSRVVRAAPVSPAGGENGTGGPQRLPAAVGTPRYMAPEQWRGDAIDCRTDIYAVGCLLHELLTGRSPFDSRTKEGQEQQHLSAPLPPLPAARLGALATALDAVLALCLAKEPAQRYASPSAVVEALEGIHRAEWGEPRSDPGAGVFTAVDYTNRGTTFAALGRHTEALTDYAAAMGLDPNLAPAYFNRGNTYHSMGRHPEALADYDIALRLDPSDAKVHVNRGTTFDVLGRYSEALVDYAEALRLNPRFAQAYLNRGNTYADLGFHAEALADYGVALRLDPSDPSAYSNRGSTFAALGRHPEALADYGEALRLDPNHIKAYSNRGKTYFALGRHREALADYDEALRLDPSDAKAYVNRGITHEALGRHPEALADYAAALRLDPTLAQAHFNRGNTYADQGRHAEALADYGEALRLDPRDAQAHVNAGVVHSQRDDWPEALRAFEAAERLGDTTGAQYASIARAKLSQRASSELP